MFRRATLVLILILIASSASAFDGDRKGFVLGLGVGGGGTNYEETFDWPFSASGDTTISATKGSFLTNFIIGAGLSQQLLIHYTNFGSWFGENDVTFMAGISSAGVTYFFKPEGPSFLIEGGAGLGNLSAPFEDNYGSVSGWGAWVGAGYEFSTHWIVQARGGYLGLSDDNVEDKLIVFGATFSYLAY